MMISENIKTAYLQNQSEENRVAMAGVKGNSDQSINQQDIL